MKRKKFLSFPSTMSFWQQVIGIVCLVSLVNGQVIDEPLCSIRRVKTKNLDPSTLSVSWSTNCNFVSRYKIYATQMRYKACAEDDASIQSHFKVEETAHASHILTDLKPFSDYQIEILAILPLNGNISRVINVSTPEGFPDTLPKLQGRVLTFSQSVRLYWDFEENCQKQNGVLDGFHVKILGTDSWVANAQSIRQRNLSVGTTTLYVDELSSYTKYEIQVYSMNKHGLYNHNLYLNVPIQTKSVTPKPPSDIKLHPEINSVQMQWVPSYPPTGQVDMYVIRVGKLKPDKTVDWQKRQEVPASQDWCQNTKFAPKENSFCWIVSDLNPDQEYYFEVKTFNVNVTKSSNFSKTVFTRTKPDPNLVKITNKTEGNITQQPNFTSSRTPRADSTTLESSEGYGHTTAVVILSIILCIFLILFMIGFFVYKIKAKQIQSQYETQAHIDRSNAFHHDMSRRFSSSASVAYTSGLSAITDMTFASGSRFEGNSSYLGGSQHFGTINVEDIQNRRLPEPPPSRQVLQMHTKPPVTSNEYSSVDEATNSEYMEPSVSRIIRPESLDDIDGYLKPTFNQTMISSKDFGMDSSIGPPKSSTPVPIPVESYESPRNLILPQCDQEKVINSDLESIQSDFNSKTHKESLPLIRSKIVDL